MTPEALEATIAACNDLIVARFPAGDDQGAAAMLLADGSIVTGTAPSAANPSVELCHEVEPYCAAYRLAQGFTLVTVGSDLPDLIAAAVGQLQRARSAENASG